MAPALTHTKDPKVRKYARLSAVQIAAAAWRAGFGFTPPAQLDPGWLSDIQTGEGRSADNPVEIIMATAIALAESGGRVGALHKNANGSVDRGLWQINSVHTMFDAKRLLSDPDYNAQAARAVFLDRQKREGNGWRAWSSYRSGAYLLHKQRARLAVRKLRLLEGGVGTGSNLATVLDERVRDLNPLGKWDEIMEAIWPYLLKTALAGTGLALIAYGIKGLFGSTTAAKEVA